MKDYGKEEVLIVPADKIPLWKGAKPASQEILDILRRHGSMIRRKDAEGNPRLKQIIPYCVLYHVDGKGTRRLFYAQRKSSADRELGGKWTIGLGGHINPKDARRVYRRSREKKITVIGLNVKKTFDRTILNCAKRELNEELEIDWKNVLKIKYLALVFTSSDSVSRDHLAVVLLIKMKTKNVRIKEEEFVAGGFYTEEEFMIYTDFGSMLTWLHETPEGQYMDRNWPRLTRGIIRGDADIIKEFEKNIGEIRWVPIKPIPDLEK